MKKSKLIFYVLLPLIILSCNNQNETQKKEKPSDTTEIKNNVAEKNDKTFKSVDEMVENAKKQITEINPNELKELIDSEEPFLLIDIRTESEYEKGHIKNTVNIPRGVLEFRIAKETFWENEGIYMPQKNELIILSCKSGKRGSLAALTLKSLGYTNVKNLKGGYKKIKMLYPEILELPEGVTISSQNNEEEDDGGC